MSVFFILEYIDVDVLAIAIRVTVGEHYGNVRVLIVRLGFFFRHLHPFATSWSIVVME